MHERVALFSRAVYAHRLTPTLFVAYPSNLLTVHLSPHPTPTPNTRCLAKLEEDYLYSDDHPLLPKARYIIDHIRFTFEFASPFAFASFYLFLCSRTCTLVLLLFFFVNGNLERTLMGYFMTDPRQCSLGVESNTRPVCLC